MFKIILMIILVVPLSYCSKEKNSSLPLKDELTAVVGKSTPTVVVGQKGSLLFTTQQSKLIERLLNVVKSKNKYQAITIDYPFNESIFPPEIIAPTFKWKDSTKADSWLFKITFDGDDTWMLIHVSDDVWRPSKGLWGKIKNLSIEKRVNIVLWGVVGSTSAPQIVSRGQVSITTSKDKVGAPIFYRTVPLPFSFANQNQNLLKWRLGDISKEGKPPVVLEDIPVCANCHSFSLDGKMMGMDIDYANDKGSYVISKVSSHIKLSKEKIISWSQYKGNKKSKESEEKEEVTFGLLSQISPDGKFVISTVKDLSVFVPIDNLEYSQLFFPIKGILVAYDLAKKKFSSLPGANDPKYVQSNPSWSPDGKFVLFARNIAKSLKLKEKGGVLVHPDYAKDFIEGREEFKYDIYRVPFNNGKGGKAEPLKGASLNDKSNYFPKYSPDGKWIVFTQSKSFMLLRPDSKLYIMPSSGGKPRPLRANTKNMNSWHSWSPNSRWLVFSSKAFTSYTQLFVTHIDENGNDAPAVLLENFTMSDRAANIPEFVSIKGNGIEKIEENYIDFYSYLRESGSLLYYNNRAKSIEFLLKAKSLNPLSPNTNYSLGKVYMDQKDFSKAIETFQIALQSQETHLSIKIMSHYYLAVCYLHLNEVPKAEKHLLLFDIDKISEFSRVEKVNHKNDKYQLLGDIYSQAGNIDKAGAAYKMLLKFATNDSVRASIHQRQGVMYSNNGKYDLAFKQYEKSYQKDPLQYPAYFMLASSTINDSPSKKSKRSKKGKTSKNSKREKTISYLKKGLGIAQNLIVDDAVTQRLKTLEKQLNKKSEDELKISLLQLRGIPPLYLTSAFYQTMCSKCHGQRGGGQSGYPPLRKLSEDYLMKRLKYYRASEKSTEMTAALKGVEDYQLEELVKLIKYFSVMD